MHTSIREMSLLMESSPKKLKVCTEVERYTVLEHWFPEPLPMTELGRCVVLMDRPPTATGNDTNMSPFDLLEPLVPVLGGRCTIDLMDQQLTHIILDLADLSRLPVCVCLVHFLETSDGSLSGTDLSRGQPAAVSRATSRAHRVGGLARTHIRSRGSARRTRLLCTTINYLFINHAPNCTV